MENTACVQYVQLGALGIFAFLSSYVNYRDY